MEQKRYYELPPNGKLYNFSNETFDNTTESLNESKEIEDDWFCELAQSIVCGKITIDDAAILCKKRGAISRKMHN